MLLPLVLQLIGLMFAVLIDPYIGGGRRWMMLRIALADLGLVVQNVADFYLDAYDMFPYGRMLAGIFGYCLRPLIIVLFMHIVNDEKKHKAAWGLIGVNALIYLTALFSDVCFTIDEQDHFQRGPLGYTCHIVSVVLLAHLVYLTVRKYHRVKHSEIWIPLVNAMLIIAAVAVDLKVNLQDFPIEVLTIAVVVCSIFYYIWLHLQFVREHENALMAEQRIQILMAQIRPHFIYNSLTAIRSYLDEPDKAEEVLNHFADFLRGSIDVLEETGCIRADREFETVESYLYLERERFGEKLTVEKDIQDTDFFLPAFTVQTLVENAIGHGIRKSESGRGRVLIRSFQTELEHIIEVADDGVGFLIEKEQEKGQNMDRSHIGLSNLKQRLSLMCDGTLEIESAPGKGTLTRVRIPMDSRKTGAQGRSDVLWKL